MIGRDHALDPKDSTGARPDRPRTGTLLACLLLVACLLLIVTPASASQTARQVRGTVLGPDGDPVADARILVDAEELAHTDEEGRFTVDLEPGEWTLTVQHRKYLDLERTIEVGDQPRQIELRLRWVTAVEESVTVVGIRADQNAPMTTWEADRAEIDELAYGQDPPKLLANSPSVTWYSDSGTGSNYSYFSLRGVQQTRINMTYDGVPLNDPAEHAVYFNNFHDLLAEVDSVQVQRGVGTSSVGAPSYGGSVNFASSPPASDVGADLRLVAGAYDTTRASLGLDSGTFGDGFSLSGRVSWAETDNYRDHSGTWHRTFFLNGAWQGQDSSLKLTAFSGQERSELSYLAVDPATLEQNRRFNPLGGQETDDFGQDLAQLKYTRFVDADTLLTASLYYNGADGFFRIDPGGGDELLDFGIDQGFVGSMVTASRSGEGYSATLGLHYNDFAGDHTLDIGDDRIYLNTGTKKTANAFVKGEYRLGPVLLFGDLHLRWAEFAYQGDIDLGSVDWLFLDPRVGLRYRLSPRMSLYASVGRAQREPARLDLLEGEDNATVRHDLEAVKPESVVDFEAGVDYRTRSLALQANLYAMEFRNEIALTGELSEVGLPLRRNVEDSFRRGLEVDLRWAFAPQWTLLHNLNISHNRISEWTQFYDVFAPDGSFVGRDAITYTDVPPLLTPELITNLGVTWARNPFSVAVSGRYVADSQLDNTGLAEFELPSYTNVDVRASLDLSGWWAQGSPRVTLYVNNLLDEDDQFPAGYSYQFLVRGAGGQRLDGIPYYYPRATRHVLVALEADL